jgi:hypothetical protein
MPHVAAYRQANAVVPLAASNLARSAITVARGGGEDGDEDGDEGSDENAWLEEQSRGSSENWASPLLTLIGDVAAHEFDLLLPSTLPSHLLDQTSSSLKSKELRLRLGQMESILTQLRRRLANKTAIFLNKKAYSRGQKENTRSNALLDSYRQSIQRDADLYRLLRRYALNLDPRGTHNDWQRRLQVLNEKDVRAANEVADDMPAASGSKRNATEARRGMMLGEGHRETSWIWRLKGLGEADPGGGDSDEVPDGKHPLVNKYLHK